MTFLPGDEPTASQLNDAYPLFVRKTSDQTVNNTAALGNDAELVLAVAASTTYDLYLRLIINSGTTPDFKALFTFPAGLTASLQIQEGATPAAATAMSGPYTQASSLPINGVAADQVAVITGIVIVSSTTGNLQLQWAQNTANASNTTVKANSYMRLWKMA